MNLIFRMHILQHQLGSFCACVCIAYKYVVDEVDLYLQYSVAVEFDESNTVHSYLISSLLEWKVILTISFAGWDMRVDTINGNPMKGRNGLNIRVHMMVYYRLPDVDGSH